MGATVGMVALTRIPESTKALLESRFAVGFRYGHPLDFVEEPKEEVPLPGKP